VKIELHFKPKSSISIDYVIVTIEGEYQKVLELLEAIKEKVKQWDWEERN